RMVLQRLNSLRHGKLRKSMHSDTGGMMSQHQSAGILSQHDEPDAPASVQMKSSLRLTQSSRLIRRIARIIFVGLVATIVMMIFVPWQQSVKGNGNVVAFAPLERQQTIEAPIKGRIVRWGEGIHENAEVVQGQFIAEIRDLDDDYTERLNQQLEHTQETVRSAKEQIRTGTEIHEAAHRLVEVYQRQEMTYRQVKEEITAAQNAYVASAEQKVQSVREQLAIEQAAIPQLQQEYDRLQELYIKQNIALQKVQETEAKLRGAESKVRKASSDVLAAEKELDGKKKDREAYIQKAQVDIDYAHALYQKAVSDISKADGDIEKAKSELAKAEKELREMERKVAIQSNQILRAPMDGFVVRINPNFGSAILKEGDPICTIVPQTEDRAVQIWVSGNDAPLVHAEDPVRLQFEGWPAVQFSGWPSVAVGTFGGEVVSVDATDDGKGKFRVLVRPDPTQESWPSDQYLRQGVRANGWILLRNVPLWWEVWRKLNGFPPVVTPVDDKDDSMKSKAPKPPKP
ncbi:MAG: HlyD family efflux transporter periplasmic adaptor subunit, partial [Planctomycetaceae bacterium]|nr:HlyD family efflux transporter periplasmic adaptor subunit [Planctomycetaceae bacterium]